MIVDGGVGKLLSAQLSYLQTLNWGLFISNTTIIETTVFGDLTEAGWAGYTRASVGVYGPPVLFTPRQITTPTGVANFNNTSGSDQTFFGWFVIDPADSTLVAAVNIGSTVIPNGATFSLAPSVTDREE